MLSQQKLLTSITVIAGAIVFLSIHKNAMGQESQLPSVLIAENQTSLKQLSWVVGQTLKYKAVASQGFEKGRISGITDNSITFESNYGKSTTILLSDLTFFKTKIPGKRLAGTLSILGGMGLLLVSAGRSIASRSRDEGGTQATIGVAAIVGGIILLQPKRLNLKESWSLKTGKSLPVDTLQNSRQKKFNIGFGLGYGGHIDQSQPSGGLALYLEPTYSIKNKISLGLKLETVAATETINSISLNGQYYLSHDKIRPFIGAGIGYYSLQLSQSEIVSTNIQPGEGYHTMGFYPRVGLEFGHCNMVLDYNVLPAQTVEVYNASPSFTYTSQRKYSYVGLKLGYSFGVGKK